MGDLDTMGPFMFRCDLCRVPFDAALIGDGTTLWPDVSRSMGIPCLSCKSELDKEEAYWRSLFKDHEPDHVMLWDIVKKRLDK